jgi:1-acyl-sn-glycerol-3-phosphate acyltransferase
LRIHLRLVFYRAGLPVQSFVEPRPDLAEPRVAQRDAPPARETDASAPSPGEQGLSRLEQMQIDLVRRTLEPGPLDSAIRLGQRTLGQWWIRAVTMRLRRVVGVDRLPHWDTCRSLILVANHRSFFDLYVTTAELVARGLPHRILFPVRSTFFYDHPMGPLVNGTMSFFAMYPPIFRDRKRASLNVASLDELAALLRRGGFLVGFHPEGTRKTDSDPYTLLPAQSGVGRVIHGSRVPVVPVFVNGLCNDLAQQMRAGITGRGDPIHLVFGSPIDFGTLLDGPAVAATFRRVAERCIQAIGELGQEDRKLRASLRTVDARRAPGHE